MASPPTDVTQLLQHLEAGQPEAWERLLPLIYDELHTLARRQRQRQRSHETINTTALVHEAFLKLVQREEPSWASRTHFFRVAARAMRDVLVDYARQQRAQKRGGDQSPLSLDEAGPLPAIRVDEVLALDEALKRLEELDERQSQIVELRYFAGFQIDETAEMLGISESTVKREWRAARLWLLREMERD